MKRILHNRRLLFALAFVLAVLFLFTAQNHIITSDSKKDIQKEPHRESGFIVDDFEDGDTISLRNTQWKAFSDKVIGGKSESDMRIITGGADNSGKALSLTGKVTQDVQFGFVGAAVSVDPSGKGLDITRLKGLQFYVRGDGKTYLVQLTCKSVTDHNEFSYEFKTDKEWKRIKVPFTMFKQSPYFGQRVTWTGKDITGIIFQTGAALYPTLRFEIDNISFY
jgi:hypothetical protein